VNPQGIASTRCRATRPGTWAQEGAEILEGRMPADARLPNTAPRLSAYPLGTWLRLRFGVHRCLACGRLGQDSLQPASLLVAPEVARTWRCVDRTACRLRRLRRSRSR
jgi:hypothetical protein